ncbi:MAG: diguanylate cyclase [Planctomycetota bacterium]|nr:MAG: diguanylate cyclase [Planctomycetota bacterium]
MKTWTPPRPDVRAGSDPVEIAERVWWVGGRLPGDPFPCHAYLIEHGDQSVLIDPGSALTWPDTRKKIQAILPFSDIRWFVLHHQDPDITGALAVVEELVERDDACWITHWRAEVLLEHLAPRLPFWRVEEHDWHLDLGGRRLEFVFTPYLHFPGAFATFDRGSGTLFSSDLFGGFTDDDRLFAGGPEDFAGIDLFHQHYMPSREVLLHTLLRLQRLPIERIAPQHGRVIGGELVPAVLNRLSRLECGLYLLSEQDSDLERLVSLSTLLRDTMKSMALEREFRAIAESVLDRVRRILPIRRVEFVALADDDRALRLCSEDRFRGAFGPVPAALRRLVGTPAAAWNADEAERLVAEDPACGTPGGGDLALPLYPAHEDRLFGLALLEAPEGADRPGAEDALRLVAQPLAVAVERELLFRSLESERERIYQQSIRDPLTGLYTRRYLEDAARRMIGLHDRDPKAGFALLMIDVDHFKAVNDRHGHLAGDRVLAEVAARIGERIRESDVAVRYGGEEIAVFLPLATEDEAVATGERLRSGIAERPVDADGVEIPVTVSLGLACHRPGEDLTELVRRADGALYEAKESGRNRLRVARK